MVLPCLIKYPICYSKPHDIRMESHKVFLQLPHLPEYLHASNEPETCPFLHYTQHLTNNLNYLYLKEYEETLLHIYLFRNLSTEHSFLMFILAILDENSELVFEYVT